MNTTITNAAESIATLKGSVIYTFASFAKYTFVPLMSAIWCLKAFAPFLGHATGPLDTEITIQTTIERFIRED
jgi:hypothetical protein